AGHVLVRVEAAGFCHHDAAIMSGVLRRGVNLPRVLGHEVAGTVVGAGDGVPAEALGTRVVAMPGSLGHRLDGGFAEYLLLPWEGAVPLPFGLAPEQAALLACPMGVALKAVEDVARVQPGETVIVTGVSGGLGVHAAQVAYAAGATVIGVTGSEEKVPRLEGMPWLSGVIAPGDVQWDEMARALTDDEGAEVVIDTGGGDLQRCLGALAKRGRLVLMGQMGAGASTLFPAEAVFREAQILGSLGVERRHVERVAQLVRGGTLQPVVERTLPLGADSLKAAFHAMESRALLGRMVLLGGDARE
ncbi:MAG: zinc-binding dehydrogenase, partial [Dehalococcoidia bacterium]